MRGRDLLPVAGRAARQQTEADWRTAANRAYYALMLEVRDGFAQLGLTPPPLTAVHLTTRKRLFATGDPGVNQIGLWFDDLQRLRRAADYDTGSLPAFATNAAALSAEQRSLDAIRLLDAVIADAARRAAVIAEIQKVFP
ncbi:MAG: hypothetical protein U0746_20615 [Gemmataceae bacterium]